MSIRSSITMATASHWPVRRVFSIFGALLIVGIVVALALPGYADYSPRASVATALGFIVTGREALKSSCSDGTFASKRMPKDIALPESDPKAFVYRAVLQPIASDTVRLPVTLTDIYGRPFFGLFPWKEIAQGSILEYEFTCSADGTLSSRLAASTLEPEFLLASLRSK